MGTSKTKKKHINRFMNRYIPTYTNTIHASYARILFVVNTNEIYLKPNLSFTYIERVYLMKYYLLEYSIFSDNI